MTTGTGAAPADDAPTDYGLLLPPGWWRIPAEPVAARRSIRTLLDRRTADLPRDAVAQARHEVETRLRELIAGAQDIGALEVLVPVDPVVGMPVAASCVVTLIPATGAATVDDIAARMGEGADEVDVVEIGGGPAVRIRRRREADGPDDLAAVVVQHVIPVPGSDDTLVFAWSTPMEPFANELAALFDAVAGSLKWRWAD